MHNDTQRICKIYAYYINLYVQNVKQFQVQVWEGLYLEYICKICTKYAPGTLLMSPLSRTHGQRDRRTAGGGAALAPCAVPGPVHLDSAQAESRRLIIIRPRSSGRRRRYPAPPPRRWKRVRHFGRRPSEARQRFGTQFFEMLRRIW